MSIIQHVFVSIMLIKSAELEHEFFVNQEKNILLRCFLPFKDSTVSQMHVSE